MTTGTGATPLPREALDLFGAWLRGFAQAPDFEGRLAQAFGAGLDPGAVGGLRAAWADGSFALPRVELAGAEVLGGARGAYAAGLGTIFLDSDFASRQPAEVLAALLLEEYGHAVDHALNGASDSPGDEGRIFARVVAGPALSAAELDALRVETDAATIEVAGAPVAVEQNGTVAVTYASNRHTFSINDVLGGFDGRTYAQDPTIIDLDGTPDIPTLTDKNGDVLSPIDSEFGFYVQDFIGATDKVRDFDYAEGWAGNILDANGFVVGLATVNAVTDTFKSGQPFGTWAAGLGGNSVKAETEHYEVMAYLLSDQEYPNDPNADYALDNGLTVRGGTYDGWTVEDVLAVVGDANGDGVEDIKDVLLPNESTTSENIAYGDDYSVTLKDDGKLLYRWGTEVKRPNDIRMDVKLTLPEEWLITTDLNGNGTADVFEVNGGLGYQVTRAELVVAHNITNNPNDQIRPEDWENEGATGRTPGYFIVTDPDDPTNTLWVGGDAVKADSEHYVVMQSILSDQRYPGDPDALYPLDDNLMVIGGVFDGQYVADIIANGLVDDVNGDGSIDIRDVLAPNESTIEENIAVSNDYSVTLKDDGKLLYRWGNEIKRPNDIRMEVELPLPDEWKTPDPATPDLLPLFRVTQAELVVRHTLTNNPNDQIRPEDYENEAAIGTLPEYLVQTVDVGTPDERDMGHGGGLLRGGRHALSGRDGTEGPGARRRGAGHAARPDRRALGGPARRLHQRLVHHDEPGALRAGARPGER